MPHEAYGAHIPWQRFAETLVIGYVETRLAKAKIDALDEEEVEEEVAPDHELYDDQLTQVAYLGRLAAPQVLTKLLGMVGTASAGLLAQVNAAAAIDMSNWAICSEQMHWLVLVTGFMLTDTDSDEEEPIPREIMVASAAVPAGAGAAGDPVVGVSSTLLGFLAACAAKACTPQADRVSGLVLGDLLWWAARWAKAYLLLDASKYGDDLSASLVGHFGADSAGASTAMGTLITAACQALLGWPGDLDVAEPAAALLAALTNGATKTALALKSPNVRGECGKIPVLLPCPSACYLVSHTNTLTLTHTHAYERTRILSLPCIVSLLYLSCISPLSSLSVSLSRSPCGFSGWHTVWALPLMSVQC